MSWYGELRRDIIWLFKTAFKIVVILFILLMARQVLAHITLEDLQQCPIECDEILFRSNFECRWNSCGLSF